MKDSAAKTLSPGGDPGLSLSPKERAQVEQIARELAGLMDLPEDPRILQGAYDMVRVFVDSGIPPPEAIRTVRESLQLTMVKMAERGQRH